MGQTVSGKYRLLELMGTGGKGAVYRADHLTLGKAVAIKMPELRLPIAPSERTSALPVFYSQWIKALDNRR